MIRRNVHERLRESLRARRVSVVTGPRQSGKTTLVRQLLDELGTGTMRSLDDPGMLEAAEADGLRHCRSQRFGNSDPTSTSRPPRFEKNQDCFLALA